MSVMANLVPWGERGRPKDLTLGGWEDKRPWERGCVRAALVEYQSQVSTSRVVEIGSR